MKRSRRKAQPEQQDWPEDAVADTGEKADTDQGDTGAEQSTGWKTSTAGLAGVTRLARAGTWVLIASGPLIGVMALLGSSAPAQSAAKAAPAVKAGASTGAAGFAQLFVGAYLESGEGTEKNLAPYYSGSVSLTHPTGTRSALRTQAMDAREVSPGYWSVTIAVNVAAKSKKGGYTDAGVQYFRVAVQSTGADGSSAYTAVSLPAQVAAPAALKPGDLGYPTSRGTGSSDPASDTAASFLKAYVAGQGELDRYTSPGVRLSPVVPTPYTSIKLTSVQDNSEDDAGTKVPGDGVRRRLLVSVDATDADGNTFPLTYALGLTARAGRWEVSSLDDAPATAAASTPSNAPHSPAPSAPAASSTPGSSAAPSGS
ncbi:conjugal transfer protein [Streptomyces sp. NPDC091416]|uniref:conjugal transfer protein n=1 Tax=Streptomyces sp. NPDC091416 TaxID=3366003 RepID=UPI0038257FAA